MGHEVKVGNNVTICLEPDSRAETDRLYAALSAGGTESTGMQQMPWRTGAAAWTDSVFAGCSTATNQPRRHHPCQEERVDAGSRHGEHASSLRRRPDRL